MHSSSKQGVVSIFDLNHPTEPVATLRVRLLTYPYPKLCAVVSQIFRSMLNCA